jgi:hypothetical protein
VNRGLGRRTWLKEWGGVKEAAGMESVGGDVTIEGIDAADAGARGIEGELGGSFCKVCPSIRP